MFNPLDMDKFQIELMYTTLHNFGTDTTKMVEYMSNIQTNYKGHIFEEFLVEKGMAPLAAIRVTETLKI